MLPEGGISSYSCTCFIIHFELIFSLPKDKTEEPEQNPSWQEKKTITSNKINLHMTPTPQRLSTYTMTEYLHKRLFVSYF